MDTVTEAESRTHGRTDSAADQITDEDDDDILDPRIQRELDHLNVASSEINQLENELDEARGKYRSIVSETSRRMEVIAHDRKKSIQKSREYYKLLNDTKLAQGEALKAARQFQSAIGIYTAAKETVALAERSLQEKTDHACAQLTSAWQDMLNNGVAKVAEAEKEKTACEMEHKRRAAKFAELEDRRQLLEKKFARSIRKAKPYFDLKMELDIKLMQQKQNVTDLQAAIKANKVKYKAALRRLEKISEEIHQLRKEKLWSQVPRMPGVGAETDSITSGLSELDLDSYDIKDEPDNCSEDRESLTDYSCSNGISVTIGGDELPDWESGGSDSAKEIVEKANMEKEHTETIAESPESEDEVFEDAQTGHDNDASDLTADSRQDIEVVHGVSVDKLVDDSTKHVHDDIGELVKDEANSTERNGNYDKIEKDFKSSVSDNGHKAKSKTGADAGESERDALDEHAVGEQKDNENTEQFTDVNMSKVERPSLSGEEE